MTFPSSPNSLARSRVGRVSRDLERLRTFPLTQSDTYFKQTRWFQIRQAGLREQEADNIDKGMASSALFAVKSAQKCASFMGGMNQSPYELM